MGDAMSAVMAGLDEAQGLIEYWFSQDGGGLFISAVAERPFRMVLFVSPMAFNSYNQ